MVSSEQESTDLSALKFQPPPIADQRHEVIAYGEGAIVAGRHEFEVHAALPFTAVRCCKG
jgi:hypothetical protein